MNTLQFAMTCLTATLLLSCAAVAFGIANAGPAQPFTPAKLEALQAKGEPVLVDIYADWCSTCAAQEQALKALYADSEAISEIHWLKLNWDQQRQLAERFGAWRQSTFVLFDGDREIDRAVAQTDPQAIKAFLRQAVAR